MKYLITGGAGFIGSKLAEELLKDKKNKVYIIDNFSKNTGSKFIQKLSKNKKLKVIKKNLNNVKDYPRIYNFDYIYHFAAILGVKKVIDNPFITLNENVLSSINLINYSKKQKKLKKICFASTSEVYAYSLKKKLVKYPTPEKIDLLISNDFNPRSSYLLSKIVGEYLINYSNLDFVIFRPHNIFGPQMGFAHVIPQLTKKILKSKKTKIVIHNSNHKRTFCDINFATKLILGISHAKNSNKKIFNIGSPEKDISILRLAQKIKRILKSNKKLKSSNYQKDNSPEKRRPDMKSSVRYVNIEHNFEKRLKETVLWYKKYYTK